MVKSSQESLTLSNIEKKYLQFPSQHLVAAVLLILIVAIILSIYSFNPILATWGDNAEFVILSQSISQGKGFRLINYPTPQSNKRYPPGFP